MSHELKNTNNTPSVDTKNSFFQALRERAGDQQNLDRIRNLYEEGGLEATKSLVGSLALELISQDEEAQGVLKRIRELRKLSRGGSEEETALVKQQRELKDRYSRSILELAGIQNPDSFDAVERSRKNVQERMIEIGGDDDSVLLEKLGIVTVDENGEQKFHYPRELFDPKVNEKMDLYLGIVDKHMGTVDAAERGEKPQYEAVELDHMRRSAHDAISRDIARIIFPEAGKESFDQARRLVAKWRDNTIPNSGEEDRVLKGLRTYALLREKPNQDS